MNISFYILTYNRPAILQNCLKSLYSNTDIHPNESWIIDDGSNSDMQKSLVPFCQHNEINLMMGVKNYGIGYSFERVYNLIYQNDDADLSCIIESDYIWRKGWLEDVCAVFKASPHTLAISGTSHPDFVKRSQTHETFPEIMKEQFDKDLDARDSLYKPFDLLTDIGNIKVQGTSNSCGCLIINWKRMKAVIETLEDQNIIPYRDYKRRMDRAFNKFITHDTRRNASDGQMSSIISMYGELYLKYRGIDITKNFPFLDICDYSISQHVCGGGANGGSFPEGSTFIVSNNWAHEYLSKNPRLS